MLQLPRSPVRGDLAMTWVLAVAEAQVAVRYSAADHECIVRAEGIAALFGVIVKKIGIQSSAAEKLFSNLKRNGFSLDVPGGQINIGDFSV